MDLDGVVGALDRYVAELMAGWGPVGMAVAITDRERTLAIRPYGFASLEAQIPIVDESLFHIGSIGKSFTAFALMQEREALRLNLQAPITDFVPWFDPPRKMKPITVHDLLAHVSGIASGTESHQEPFAEPWGLRKQDPGFSPGTQFYYSNAGYKLLGFVLERLAGQRYAEAIAERVFAPVGMNASYARVTEDLRPYTAVGYHKLWRGRPPHPADPWVQAEWFISESGDGSITSTPGDMAAYARMILGGGTVPGGPQVVNLESFDLMTRPYSDDWEIPGDRYGYGLLTNELDGRGYVEHWGTMVAHRGHLLVDPQAGFGVVVLSTTGGIADVGYFVLRLLRAAQEGSPLPEAPPITPPVPTEGFAGFAGLFTCRGRTLTLVADGPTLVAEMDGAHISLEWRGEDAFYAPNSPLSGFVLRAVRGGGLPTGDVVAYTHGADRWEGPMALPIAGSPSDWTSYAGTYRSYNPWRSVFHVVLRAGQLILIDPYDTPDPGEGEFVLIPLPDGKTFRVGEQEWFPERVTFDTIVNGAAQHAVRDGGAYDRVN